MPLNTAEKVQREHKLSSLLARLGITRAPSRSPVTEQIRDEALPLSPLQERRGLKIEVRSLDDAIEVLKKEKGREYEVLELFYHLNRGQLDHTYNDIRSTRPDLEPITFCIKVFEGIKTLAGLDNQFNITNLSLKMQRNQFGPAFDPKGPLFLPVEMDGVKLGFHISDIAAQQGLTLPIVRTLAFLLNHPFEKENTLPALESLNDQRQLASFISGQHSLTELYQQAEDRYLRVAKGKKEEKDLADRRRGERREDLRWIEIQIEEAIANLRVKLKNPGQPE